MPATIYYHYFKLMLHRTDNSHTKRVIIQVESTNETVTADDTRIAFKTALNAMQIDCNVKFGYLEYERTEVYELCQ